MKHIALFLSVIGISVSAFAARPVARWDVIPNQLVSGTFKAGVVAFHKNGVKVEFECAGQKSVVDKPTYNDRVKVWEYVCPINAEKLPDGPVFVKAKAVTLDGAESHELPELKLFANAKGSLTVASQIWVDAEKGDDGNDGSAAKPLKTLQKAATKVKNGGTIYLGKGSYPIGGLKGCSGDYWTTITPADGVKRDEVELTPGRPGADHLHFKNVTFALDYTGKYTALIAGENGKTCCWVDGCKGYNKQGRWAGNSNWFGNGMRGFFTGGETTEMNNGPDGELVRDHLVHKIASDVWTGSDRLVVNCRCYDINPGKTGAHPDFYQAHAKAPGWVHDVILYNVGGYDCECQGLFGVRLRDSAFVNVYIHTNSGMYSQWSDPMINVMFWHVTLVDQSWLWRASKTGKNDFEPTDVDVRNCLFRSMGSFKPLAEFNGGLAVDHCAFYGTDKKGKSTGVYGDNAIRVDRGFKDERNRDYCATAKAALTHGVSLLCVPADVNGNPYPAGPRPVGAYAK